MEPMTDRTQILATADKLATTIDQLTVVLDDEVEGVYTHKTSEMARIYQAKTRLLADYAATVSSLRGAGGEQGVELPADMTARIKEKSNQLMLAMERNIKALQVAHEASRQVVDVIIDAVKQQRQTGAAYGKDKNGKFMASEAGSSAAAAVTLDTRL